MPMGVTDEDVKARDQEVSDRDNESLNRTTEPEAGQLTAEEIAEFRALRAAKIKQDKEYEEANKPPPPTHTLILADGRVIKSAGTMTHYQDVPVINSVEYVAPEEESVNE
jgi:hypothetical protein